MVFPAAAVLGAASKDERLFRVLTWLFVVAAVAGLVAVVAFFLNTPPRGWSINNFATAELKATSDSYRLQVSRFWAYYGPEMTAWWESLPDGPEVREIYAAYRKRGEETCLSEIYFEGQPPPVVERGRASPDVRIDFYRYPGRKLDNSEGVGNVPEDAERPSLGDSPADDYVVWADARAFDPMKIVSYDPKDAKALESYVRGMTAHERFDLFAAALPAFVRRLAGANELFKHARLEDLPGVASYLSSSGAGVAYGPGMPELVLRHGLVSGDRSCRHAVVERLREAREKLDRFVDGAVAGAIAGNAEVSLSIAEHADADKIDGMEHMSEKELLSSISSVPSVEGTALWYAASCLKAKDDVSSALALVADRLGLGFFDEASVDGFLSRALPGFEDMADYLLKMLGACGLEAQRASLHGLYAAWHGAVDPLRAMADKEGVRRAVEQIREVASVAASVPERLRAAGMEALAAETEALPVRDKAAAKRIVRKIGDAVDARALEALYAPEDYYGKRYAAFLNAVNVAAYTAEYIDDVKAKTNIRHASPIKTKHFYKIYVGDLVKAYFTRNYEGRVPDQGCSDCFEPLKSRHGGVYNVESLLMLTRRYWLDGDIEKMVQGSKKWFDAKLKDTMKNECKFPWADRLKATVTGKGMTYERGMHGVYGWGSRQGGGYFGGGTNTFWVYGMRAMDNGEVWLTDPGTWRALGGSSSAEENDALTRFTVLAWAFDDVAVCPDDVVFEECPQGGTLIYSRYPAPDGYHRYLTVDERGTIRWDNKIRIGSNAFSACSAGSRGGAATNFAGNLEVSSRRMGEVPAPTEQEIRKIDDIIRTDFGKEGFQAEPSACDAVDDQGIEYCEPTGPGSDPGEMASKGLFQVQDVADPPGRSKLGAVRRVVITSLSKRLEDPEHENKRLLVIALDPATGKTRLAMLDDVVDNRNRAVMELVNTTINANGAVVIGSPLPADDGGYPYFLETRPVVDSNRDVGRATNKGRFVVTHMRQRGWENSRTMWVNSAASVLAAWLSVATFGKSLPLSLFSAVVSVGSAAAATHQGLRSSQAARALVATAIATNMLIYNNLGSGAINPYTQKSTRFILSLARPGLHPEFELVPYMLNVGTVGADRKRDDGATTLDAKYVMRDREEMSNSLVLVPARNATENGADDLRIRKDVYPTMITEHDSDNFSRIGRPFYLFSLKKRMFLVPPASKEGPPVWVSTAADKPDKPRAVKVALKGTRLALRSSGSTCSLNEMRPDEPGQTFDMSSAGAAFRLSDRDGRAFYGDAPKLLAGIKSSAGGASDDEWWQMDRLGRLQHRASGLFLIADYNPTTKRYSGRLGLATTPSGRDAFEIVGEASCGQISYEEKDLLEGRSPESECVRPWYFYEMNVNDPDIDDTSVPMDPEPDIMRLGVEVKGADELREESNIQHNTPLPSRKRMWHRPAIQTTMTQDAFAPNLVVVGRWVWSKEYHTAIRSDKTMSLASLPLQWGNTASINVAEKTYVLGPRTRAIIKYDGESETHENALYDKERVVELDGLSKPGFHQLVYEKQGTVTAERIPTPEDKLQAP